MSWEVRTREHVFGTGRSAVLREQLPSTSLIRAGVLDADAFAALEDLVEGQLSDPLKAAKLTDAICVGMFVDPTVSLDGTHKKAARGTPEVVPIEVLEESEIFEVIKLAFESAGGIAGFRVERSGADGRDDRPGVARAAKQPSRARARKPKGTPTRRKAR